MKQELEQAVAGVCKDLFNVEADIELTRPEEQFGDYATNVALQLAKQVGRNPREVAEQIAPALKNPAIASVDIAGPGFLNITLTDPALVKLATEQPAKSLEGKEVLVEFGDPNPFKEMHIGHLYSYIVGDAICSLLESAGAQVRRLSYHGDVGLHVAKAIWGMQQEGVDETKVTDAIKNNIGLFYAKGAAEYEKNETARHEIDELNKKIYLQDPSIEGLYKWGKDTSFGSFDRTLHDLAIKNDKANNAGRYLESESAPIGLELVKQNIGKVFQESDGAVIYDGEKAGLHTRVFITGKGLPTYETKDLGLTELKNRDFPNAAQSIIITANEQAEYFKVMLSALNEINPTVAAKTKHMTHGFVSLSTGKMSSRTGDVYRAINLIADVEMAIKSRYPDALEENKLGAIKYAFTKHRLGGDITYDVSESITLEGNSGPYLQYAHARARSILAKTEAGDVEIDAFEPGERSLVRKISEYAEVVDKAVAELMPHHVCTYLFELAQVFNSFYEHNRVLGDERERMRIHLVGAYADTLKNGLELLNIPAPDRM